MTYRATGWRRKDVKDLRKTIAIAASTALLVGALGAATVQAQDEVVIGYVAPSLVGAQLQIQQGLVNGAEAKGWEVLTVTSDGDAQKQLNDINDYIAQGVDAIVAVPDDSAGICVAVQNAKDAGIPFYTIDRAPTGCEINMTVLSDNYLAGQQSGEAIVAYLTEKYGEPKGTVLEITGNMAQNVAQLRGGGFQDVVTANEGIDLITKIGDWEAEKGVDIVRDVVSAEDVDAIYYHSDCVYTPGTHPGAQRAEQARAARRRWPHLPGRRGCLSAGTRCHPCRQLGPGLQPAHPRFRRGRGRLHREGTGW